ncbi:hypothetical protein SDC9_135242 [bioreactor metagenome]|uniref:Uncharacterized protein n=1 Tax=bioreactor metagenome TaxID=1076179 RepID=A0A645DFX1_9ZZZZ
MIIEQCIDGETAIKQLNLRLKVTFSTYDPRGIDTIEPEDIVAILLYNQPYGGIKGARNYIRVFYKVRDYRFYVYNFNGEEFGVRFANYHLRDESREWYQRYDGPVEYGPEDSCFHRIPDDACLFLINDNEEISTTTLFLPS